MAQCTRMLAACGKAGAGVFVFYTFPRHLAQAEIAARRDLLRTDAEAMGIEFVEAVMPDPTSGAGVTATEDYLRFDIPSRVEAHQGKTVAFYTSCETVAQALSEHIADTQRAFDPCAVIDNEE